MRRLAAVFALASASLVALAEPVPVHAANTAPETDLIARKLTTQTTGPSGFQSPISKRGLQKLKLLGLNLMATCLSGLELGWAAIAYP